jgi:hypothetical protein
LACNLANIKIKIKVTKSTKNRISGINMSDCCSFKNIKKKHKCPINGEEYKEISIKTLLHHIQEPWNLENTEQSYYFCEDPECNVVYFGKDNIVIEKMGIRTIIGMKEKANNTPLCYCFGITKNDAIKNSKIKEFVLEKTKNKICACDIRNPSGKCCLRDFPKTHKAFADKDKKL